MRALLDDLMLKYANKPLLNLIMLDSKADLEFRMNVLSAKSETTEKINAFESFGDCKQLFQERKHGIGSLENVLDILTLKSCLIAKLKSELGSGPSKSKTGNSNSGLEDSLFETKNPQNQKK